MIHDFIPDLPDDFEVPAHNYSDRYQDDEPSRSLVWVLGSIGFATGFAFVIGAKLAGWW